MAVDFGDLVRKLVLSEQIILETDLLSEFPPLLRKFGYDGVTQLLASGRLRVAAEFVTFGQTGQTTILEARAKKGPLPLGSYSLSIIKLHEPKEHLNKGMRQIDAAPGLSARQSKNLRKLIGGRIITSIPDLGQPALRQTERDMEHNVPLLRTAVAVAARAFASIDVDAASLDLRVERIDEQDWRTQTNLGELAGLDPHVTHSIVERALLGVAGLNQRVEYMERFQALTGFKTNELPLMEEKLGFLARQLDPDVQRDRFERVFDLVGLPDVDPDPDVQDVDMVRLLEVVASDEAREFRQWLRGIDSMDDQAVKDQLRRIRELIGHAIRSKTGKTVRYLTTTGLGIAVPPAGIAAGALDMFLTEKLIPKDGPSAFLSRLYPSVFQS